MDLKRETRDLAEMLMIVVVFALFLRTFVIDQVHIPSASMEPTLLVGDHLFVNRFVYAPHLETPLSRLLPYSEPGLGDVVTLVSPDEPRKRFIKRCVAVGGDSVEIRAKGLALNDEPVDEPYAVHRDATTWPDDPDTPPSRRLRDHMDRTAVPENHIFVLGDNRDNSTDSRFWGPAPRTAVRGRPLLVYWSFASTRPPREDGDISRGDGLEAVLHFFSRTRWSRTGTLVR